MAIPTKVDYAQKGLSLLPSYWDDKPIAIGLVKSLLEQLQPVEDCLFEMLNERNIYDAVGVQLDELGGWFSISRNGLSDDEYRREILREGVLLYVDGTLLRTAETANAFVNRTDSEVIEYLGGLAIISIKGSPYNGITELFNTKVVPAGVKAVVTYNNGSGIKLPDIADAPFNLVTDAGDYVGTSSTIGDRLLTVDVNAIGRTRGILPDIAGNKLVDGVMSHDSSLQPSFLAEVL